MPVSCWKCGAPPTPLHALPPPSVNLTHLLGTNDPPSEDEIGAARGVISAAQGRMELLDSHISELRLVLIRLRNERTETEQIVQKYRVILSPIRRLPPELVCEIFSLVPCTRRVGYQTVSQPPWRLAHINRSTRAAALTYTALWSSLHVAHVHWGSLAAMIETQYSRASNAPLDVTFWYWIDGPEDPASVKALLLHSTRWRTLSIRVNHGYEEIMDVLNRVKNQLPSLHTLTLEMSGENPLPTANAFSSARGLRTVLLTDISCRKLSPSPTSLQLPWGDLVRYRGKYTIPRQLAILRRTPKLLECSLGDIRWIGSSELPPVQLNHLRRLHCERAGILAHLATPALEILSLNSEPLDALAVFLLRSPHHHLTTLVLMSCRITSARAITLAAAIHSAPALTYLLLDATKSESADKSAFFRAMTLDGAGAPPTDDVVIIAPKLRKFLYGARWFDDASTDALFDMVRSRNVQEGGREGANFQNHRPHTRALGLSHFRVFSSSQEADADFHHLEHHLKRLSEEGVDAKGMSYDAATKEMLAMRL
ncbi:hypothetical protein C8R43DRAFT_1128444 [Mycena crocata]|nr:hypothetical protein C8R43DRAFT_1128444 [Mycena crocata]